MRVWVMENHDNWPNITPVQLFCCGFDHTHLESSFRGSRYLPKMCILCPQDQKSGGILFLSCLSFCHSVLLSETLTLLITFEQWVLELWYFTCHWVFHVKRLLLGYQPWTYLEFAIIRGICVSILNKDKQVYVHW